MLSFGLCFFASLRRTSFSLKNHAKDIMEMRPAIPKIITQNMNVVASCMAVSIKLSFLAG
jgi:hypothetical protein